MVRAYAPLAILLIAFLVVGLSCFGSEGLVRLRALQASVQSQRQSNEELQKRVETLRKTVYALREDERELEKAARNELGLARPNEEILIFERKKQL